MTAAAEAGLLGRGYVWILVDGSNTLATRLPPSLQAQLHGVLTFDYAPPASDALARDWASVGASACENSLFSADSSVFTFPPGIIARLAYDGVAALALAMHAAEDPTVGTQVALSCHLD